MKKTLVLLTFLLGAPTPASPGLVQRFLYKSVIDPAIDLTARQNIRHVTPVGILRAKGLVREIYGQVQADFAPPAEPFLLLSPSPEALLGFWVISYESFVPVHVPRVAKETLAVSVAVRNGAPYCEQAHRAVALSTQPSEEIRAAFRNSSFLKNAALPEAIRPYHAFASGLRPDHRIAGIPDEQVPEVVGVTLAFHFITRLIDVFTYQPVFQVTGNPPFKDRAFETMAKWRVGSLARATHPTFTAIRLAEKYGFRPRNEAVPTLLENTRIGFAFALWSDIMESVRARLIDKGVPETDLAAIEAGTVRPDASPFVRFALAIAQDNRTMLPQEVQAVRMKLGSDQALVDLASWSAYVGTLSVAKEFR